MLCLIVRLALVAYVAPYTERYIQGDAIGYDQIAKNLAAGHGFSMKADAPYLPDNFRTPGYPAIVALFYILFGYRPDLVLYAQAVMGALTILPVYWIGSRVGGKNAGLLAAILLAISPQSITYAALLWSDTAYTLIFAISIMLTLLMLMSDALWPVAASATVSGLAVLIHPRSLYLPRLFALILVGVRIARRVSFRAILLHAVTYLAVFNLVLLPWELRNKAVFGVPNITSAAGINMLDYGAALTEAARTGENQWSIAKRYDEEVRQSAGRALNEAEFGEAAFRLGLQKIAADPWRYLRVQAIGMAKVFAPGVVSISTLLTGRSGIDATEVFGVFVAGESEQGLHFLRPLLTYPLPVLFFVGFEVLYLAAVGLLCLRTIFRRRDLALWLILIAIISFYLVAVAGPAGAPRFRVALMPSLCVFAALGCATLQSEGVPCDSR